MGIAAEFGPQTVEHIADIHLAYSIFFRPCVVVYFIGIEYPVFMAYQEYEQTVFVASEFYWLAVDEGSAFAQVYCKSVVAYTGFSCCSEPMRLRRNRALTRAVISRMENGFSI